jgi:hypothetical protein
MEVSGQLHAAATLKGEITSPGNVLNRSLSGPHGHSGSFEERKKYLSHASIRKVHRSMDSLIAILTELYRLLIDYSSNDNIRNRSVSAVTRPWPGQQDIRSSILDRVREINLRHIFQTGATELEVLPTAVWIIKRCNVTRTLILPF